jgi:Transglutaminase-like superfamily
VAPSGGDLGASLPTNITRERVVFPSDLGASLPTNITRERVVFPSAIAKARWLGDAAVRDSRLPLVRWTAWMLAPKGLSLLACAERFQAYCRDKIRFVDDPDNFETFESSDVTLVRGYNDCDGKARTFVALCLARGVEARIRNIFSSPDDFYHVQAEVRIPGTEQNPSAENGWLVCEFTLQSVELGQGGEASREGAFNAPRWLAFSPAVPSRWTPAMQHGNASQAASLTRDEHHRWARPILIQAWQNLFGTSPSVAALQMVGGQASLETVYGYGWSAASGGQGSNNWGAVDWTPASSNDYFESTDHDAQGNTISVKFKKYDTPLDGATDFLNQALIVRPLAMNEVDTGNATAYADALRRSHYFVAPTDQYALAIYNNAKEIANALGEPLLVNLDSPGPSSGLVGGGSAAAAVLLLFGAAAVLGYVVYEFT